MALLAEAEALFGDFEPGNALFNGDAAAASAVTVPVPLLWDSRAISVGWTDSRAIRLNQ